MAFSKTLGSVDQHTHLMIDHPSYGHAAIIGEECRRDMARDLD